MYYYAQCSPVETLPRVNFSYIDFSEQFQCLTWRTELPGYVVFQRATRKVISFKQRLWRAYTLFPPRSVILVDRTTHPFTRIVTELSLS